MNEPLTGKHVTQVKAGLKVLRGHAAYATRDDVWDGAESALVAIADLERQLKEACKLVISAQTERDEAQGKLEAVREWRQQWRQDGTVHALDAILRGTKELTNG